MATIQKLPSVSDVFHSALSVNCDQCQCSESPTSPFWQRDTGSARTKPAMDACAVLASKDVLCPCVMLQCYCAAYVSCGVWPQLVSKLLATWRCCCDPRPKGLNLPHRREYSGNTCQGNHIPDAPANVNIKSSARIRARQPCSAGYALIGMNTSLCIVFMCGFVRYPPRIFTSSSSFLKKCSSICLQGGNDGPHVWVAQQIALSWSHEAQIGYLETSRKFRN